MFLVYFILLQTIYCQTLNNIFQSLSISNPSEHSRPQDIRTATLTWKLKSDDVMSNDKFSLTLPYVFRTKFGSSTLSLTANGMSFADCKIQDGSVYYDNTILTCIVTNKLNSSETIVINGYTSFDFVFNAGGSTSEVDISAANHWLSGKNIVNWGNLSTEVEFEKGPFFATDSEDSSLIYYSRSTPQDYEQVYLLSNPCSGGITKGELAITTNSTFDCTLFDLSSTNNINDFFFPKEYSSIRSNISCSDDKKTLIASFENIPQGYRVFLQGFMVYSEDTDTVKHSYYSSLTCGNGKVITDSINRVIEMEYGKQESGGNITTISTKTQHWTNTYTSITTIPCSPGESTETVIIQIPSTITSTICTKCLKVSSEVSSDIMTSSYSWTNSDTSQSLSTSTTTDSICTICVSSNGEVSSKFVGSSLLDTSSIDNASNSSWINTNTNQPYPTSTTNDSTYTSCVTSSSEFSSDSTRSSILDTFVTEVTSSFSRINSDARQTFHTSTVSNSVPISESTVIQRSTSSELLHETNSAITTLIKSSSTITDSTLSSQKSTTLQTNSNTNDISPSSYSSDASKSSFYPDILATSNMSSTIYHNSQTSNPTFSTDIIISLNSISNIQTESQKERVSSTAPKSPSTLKSSDVPRWSTSIWKTSSIPKEITNQSLSTSVSTQNSDSSHLKTEASSTTVLSYLLSYSLFSSNPTSKPTNVAESTTRNNHTTSNLSVGPLSESPRVTTLIETVTNTVSEATKLSVSTSLSSQSMPPLSLNSVSLPSFISSTLTETSTMVSVPTPIPSVYKATAFSITYSLHYWFWAIFLPLAHGI